MGARLGFGTLTALEVETLLIDEVLAVGDATFQRKCIDWLDEYRLRGRTLVFVSHNQSLVRHMTSRAIWLDHGRIEVDGYTLEVVTEYATRMEQRVLEGQRKGKGRKLIQSRGLKRWGTGGARIDEVRIDRGAQNDHTLDLYITYESPDLRRALVCVGLADDSGTEVGVASSSELALAHRGAIRCRMELSSLAAGVYFPIVGILSLEGSVSDRWELDRAVVVEPNAQLAGLAEFGKVRIQSSWSAD
jgi:ABC-type sugar transport system ATPase subunit